MKTTVLLILALWGLNGALSGQVAAVADPRIRAHYSDTQIEQMQQEQPHKWAQVQFYFTQSFELQRNDRCTQCPPPDASLIDITRFEQYRKAHERVTVSADNKGGHFLILLSRDELREAYQKF